MVLLIAGASYTGKTAFTQRLLEKYANIIEARLDNSSCTMESLIADNAETLRMCRLYHVNYHLIDSGYPLNLAFDCFSMRQNKKR